MRAHEHAGRTSHVPSESARLTTVPSAVLFRSLLASRVLRSSKRPHFTFPFPSSTPLEHIHPLDAVFYSHALHGAHLASRAPPFDRVNSKIEQSNVPLRFLVLLVVECVGHVQTSEFCC